MLQHSLKKCSPSFKPLTLRTTRAHRKIGPKCTKLHKLPGKIQLVGAGTRVPYLKSPVQKITSCSSILAGRQEKKWRKREEKKQKQKLLPDGGFFLFFLPISSTTPHPNKAGWLGLSRLMQATNHQPHTQHREGAKKAWRRYRKHGNRNRESTASRSQCDRGDKNRVPLPVRYSDTTVYD